MIKACQSGHGVAMTVKSYTRYGHWKNCGKVSKSNLRKGDVLVRSNHVMTYIGDGKIVHAAGGNWGANSIQVTSLGSRSYSFVMRYTGVGRGYHDVIRDFNDKGDLVDEEGNVVREGVKKVADDSNAGTAGDTGNSGNGEEAAAGIDQPQEEAKPEEPETGDA